MPSRLESSSQKYHLQESIHIPKRLDWAEMTRANSSTRAPRARKVVHAEVENIGFGGKAQLFLDFDFTPQPGSIEAVLPAQSAPVKGRESGRKTLYPSGSR